MAARAERTGRKVLVGPASMPLGAFSIAGFCLAHSLSEAMFFKMRAQGLGPDEMAVGRRRMISIESAARWRVEREAAAKAAIREAEGKLEKEPTG